MTKEGNVIGNIERTQPAGQGRWLSPFDEIDRLSDDFLSRGFLLRPIRGMTPEAQPFEGRMPRVDAIDRENDILPRAELPGVDKKNFDVSVGENAATLKAEVGHEDKEEQGDYFRREITRAGFARTLTLSAYVDSEKAEASFKDGILELTLLKLEQSKRQRIKVD